MAKRIRTTPLPARIDPAEVQPPTPERLAELRTAAQIFSSASKAGSRPSALAGLGQSMFPPRQAAPRPSAASQVEAKSQQVTSPAAPPSPALRSAQTPISSDDIARRAYEIWLRTGGASEANWLAAEAELRKERGG
jgi:hypothetical protein